MLRGSAFQPLATPPRLPSFTVELGLLGALAIRLLHVTRKSFPDTESVQGVWGTRRQHHSEATSASMDQNALCAKNDEDAACVSTDGSAISARRVEAPEFASIRNNCRDYGGKGKREEMFQMWYRVHSKPIP